jgi:RNA-directed DNA polymerase
LETTTVCEGKPFEKLHLLRAKLGQKAKREPCFRFYSLYGHLFREDVLQLAWLRVEQNGGAPGIDNVTFTQIKSSNEGVLGFLEELRESLRNKTYHASPVKRVYIPKSNGKLRPLGIPTIRDRVAQMALLLMIEPIFEEDFLECSFGFRPEKSAHQALDQVVQAIEEGKVQVYDADIQSYFDTIPHDKLLKALEHRIADRHVLALIRQWLRAPVHEAGQPMKRTELGTPQGGVISPLLANLFLHWFDKVFHSNTGPATWAKAKLVRYADDFVILARYLTSRIQQYVEMKIEAWMGLQLNREKTKVIDLNRGESFTFLGYTFRYISRKCEWKGKYCYLTPSQAALVKAKASIRGRLGSQNSFLPPEQVVKKINLFLQGWGAYFCKGYPSKTFSKLNYYVGYCLMKFLRRKSQRGYRMGTEESWYKLFTEMGLLRIRKKTFVTNA